LNFLVLPTFAAISENMSTQNLSEQELIRREKLSELQKLGIDPYPAPLYPVNITSKEIREKYLGDENKNEFADVCLAGRIMGVRDMGKASFAILQDHLGKIQIYVRRDDIAPTDDKMLYDQVWKTLDIGDIIGVKGHVFTTKTGETSVHVKVFTLLSKSLKPLPVVKEKEGETGRRHSLVYQSVDDDECERFARRPRPSVARQSLFLVLSTSGHRDALVNRVDANDEETDEQRVT
jgi:lysyl-tRNA synthetase class II